MAQHCAGNESTVIGHGLHSIRHLCTDRVIKRRGCLPVLYPITGFVCVRTEVIAPGLHCFKRRTCPAAPRGLRLWKNRGAAVMVASRNCPTAAASAISSAA